jgi:hypothetical protein
LTTATGEGPIRDEAALDLDDVEQAPADGTFARIGAVQLEDQEAFGSIDDAVVVWLRETVRSLVAELEKSPFGDSAPNTLIQRIERCDGQDASVDQYTVN